LKGKDVTAETLKEIGSKLRAAQPGNGDMLAASGADALSREELLAAQLLHRLAGEAVKPDAPEALAVALALDFGAGRFADPHLAYTGFLAALQAAADLQAQPAAAPLDAILQEVCALNAAGERDEARARLEAALRDAPTDAAALRAAALVQDRICNRPDLAAERHIAALKAEAPAGGVFRAAVDLLYARLEAGEKAGDPFDMLLALELAKALHKRAKGPELGQAQTSLGNCHQVIGQFRPGRKHLDLAAELFAAAAKAVARTKQPENWAFAQHNIGGIHELIGLRHQDAAMLRKAAKAYAAVLEVFNSQGSPLEWANTTAARANVRAALGRMTGDSALIETAIEDLEAALEALKRADHPAEWASAVSSLALARRLLAETTGDVGLLRTAIEEFEAADAVQAELEAPAVRARLQHHLGLTCLALAAAFPAQDWLDRAETAFAAALGLARRDCGDYRWPESLSGLGRVALVRAQRGDGAQKVVAQRLLSEAQAVLSLDPASAAAAECANLLAEAARPDS